GSSPSNYQSRSEARRRHGARPALAVPACRVGAVGQLSRRGRRGPMTVATPSRLQSETRDPVPALTRVLPRPLGTEATLVHGRTPGWERTNGTNPRPAGPR